MNKRTNIIWTPELVSRFWDGIADSPLDDLSFGRVAGPKLLDLVQVYLRPEGRHLDFGAGSGHLLKLMVERGYRVAGFDPAPDRQAKLTANLVHSQKFLGWDGLDSRAQYDVVFLLEVIEHILEPQFEETMERVVRFVAPGGWLIVSTPNSEDLVHSQVFCPISQVYFHPWQHVRSFSPKSLGALLARHGLRKEMVILADFSNDASLIAELNELRMRDGGSSRIRQQEVEASTRKLLRLARELKAFAYGVRVDSSRWRCLTRSLQSDEQRMARAEQLAKLAEAFDQELANTHQLAIQSVGHVQASGQDDIDLRIGKETTIVYIARKPNKDADTP